MNRLPVLRWTDGSVEVELMEAGMRSAGVRGRERPERREKAARARGGRWTERHEEGNGRVRGRKVAGEQPSSGEQDS